MVLLFLFQVLCSDPVETHLTLISPGEERAGSLAFSGFDAEWFGVLKELSSAGVSPGEFFGVYLGEKVPENMPAMLGHWELVDQTLYFRPRFSFLPDRAHVARLDMTGLGKAGGQSLGYGPAHLDFTFTTPAAAPRQTARVTQVYPSGDQLPANLLRLYINFSAPMRRGLAYAGIRVLDDKGLQVPRPFVIVPEELWDPSGTRLTVLFDPGRIKRGLDPNIEDGPPLEPGHNYTLVVDATREDVGGRPLLLPYVKNFHVVDPDRASPNPDMWTLIPARAGTTGALELETGESLDYPLLARGLVVTNEDGVAIQGRVELNDSANRWRFYPSKPWLAGDYHLHVSPELEDLAGNRVYRLFDETRDPAPQPEEQVLNFRVR